MSALNVDLSDLDAVKSHLPHGKPVFMLNLLRFRAEALYQGHRFDELEKVSGREAYLTRYLPAFAAIASPLGEQPPTLAGNSAGAGGGRNEDDGVLIRAAAEDQASGAMHVDPGTKDHAYSRTEVRETGARSQVCQ
jgi:hypothetical protein